MGTMNKQPTICNRDKITFPKAPSFREGGENPQSAMGNPQSRVPTKWVRHPKSAQSAIRNSTTRKAEPAWQRVPRTRNPKLEMGFTLIELLVVVVIISVIASLVGPALFKKVGRSERVAAQAQIEIFGVALDNYRLDNGHYPITDQGLEALWRRPTIRPLPENWDGPYLKKEIPLDPWGNPYIYLCPGRVNPGGYDLLSYGRDGQEGGEGEEADIVSWRNLDQPE